jgi:hypothetical protein
MLLQGASSRLASVCGGLGGEAPEVKTEDGNELPSTPVSKARRPQRRAVGRIQQLQNVIKQIRRLVFCGG